MNASRLEALHAIEPQCFVLRSPRPEALGLLAHDSQSWLIPASRHRPLLDAALDVWSELDAVGERYAVGRMPRRLWSVPNNLHFVLANLGVPAPQLDASLLPEGPRALRKYVRPVN